MWNLIHKYWSVGTASFQEQLAYRINILIETLGTLITSFLVIVLWYSLFTISSAETLNGFTLQTMAIYLLGVGIVISILHVNGQGDKQMMDINQGVLNNYLLKPMSPFLFWLVNDLARKVMMFIFIGIPSIISVVILSLWFDFALSVFQVAVFIVVLAIAAVLHFLIFYWIALTTFWTGMSWGLSLIFRVFMALATGAFVPLEFFPPGWRELFFFLPFQYFGHFPVEILLGRLTVEQIGIQMLYMFLWCIGLYLLSRFIYLRGVRMYGAYGG